MTSKSDNLVQESGTPKAGSTRRAYNSPVLQRFGRLSRLTQGSGGNGNDGGGVMTMMSDPGVKQAIVCVGMLPIGVNLYVFDYLPAYRGTAGYGRQLGVMADEVERVLPEAVSLHSDGYKRVDYAMLDISPGDVISAFSHR